MSKYKEQFRPGSSHEIISGWIRPGSSVLDVGCGTGYLAKCLLECGCSVMGLEGDAENVVCARRRGVTVEQTDLNNFGELFDLIGDRCFDYVVCADVLEHLEAPWNLLRMLRRNISGSLVVSIPNVAHWSVRRDLLFGRWSYTKTGILDQTHLRFFTHETATVLLNQSGYEVVREDCTPHPMTVPSLIYRDEWPHRINRVVSCLRPSLLAMQFVFEARP